jgi:hypothetical protein
VTAIRGPLKTSCEKHVSAPQYQSLQCYLSAVTTPAGIDDVAGLYNDTDHKFLTIDIDRYFKDKYTRNPQLILW